jgi:hypothetical protein
VAIELRQAAQNAKHSGQGRTCTVTFDERTKQSSTIMLFIAVSSGNVNIAIDDVNFEHTRTRSQGDLTLAHYRRGNATPMDSVTVRINKSRSFEVIAMEYTGIRLDAALDKSVSTSRRDNRCDSGTSATSTQAESLVIAGIANLRNSCRQSGFTGGLTRLFDQVTPDVDGDVDRIRMTVHQYIASSTGQFRLRGNLSSHRDWAGILAVYKGASTGPARFSAVNTDDDHHTIRMGGVGVLTAFGPLQATATTPASIVTGGSADMWPFDYQYALNNRRMLIGVGTDYRVLDAEGLNGWQMRTSDSDQPLADGAVRGVDLMSARQILFNIATLPHGGTTEAIEASLRTLYDTLIPSRNQDWELVWRHPGQGVRMLRCRPIDLIRGMDAKRVLLQDQKFALRAVDPRHYSPLAYAVQLTVSDETATVVNEVTTEGTAPAYPVIRAVANETITRLELINDSADVAFDLKTTVGSGSVVVADMDSRVRSTGTSPVTVDGVSKYGAWQFPRASFYLAPNPEAEDGINQLRVHTEPVGADVDVTLEFRHTYYG